MSTITSTAGCSSELSSPTELPTLESIHRQHPDLTLAVSLAHRWPADPEAEEPELSIRVQSLNTDTIGGGQSGVPQSFEPEGEIKQIAQSLQRTLQRHLEYELKSHLPLGEGSKPTFGGLCGPHRKEVEESMSRATQKTVAIMTGIDWGRNATAEDYQKGDAATWISFVPIHDPEKDPRAQEGLSVHTTRQPPSQHPCRYASNLDSAYGNCNVRSILTDTAKASQRLSGLFNEQSLEIGLVLTEGGPLHRDQLTRETRCNNVQLTDDEEKVVSLIGEALCEEVRKEFNRRRATMHRSVRNDSVLREAVFTTRSADDPIPFWRTSVVSRVVKRPSWWKRGQAVTENEDS